MSLLLCCSLSTEYSEPKLSLCTESFSTSLAIRRLITLLVRTSCNCNPWVSKIVRCWETRVFILYTYNWANRWTPRNEQLRNVMSHINMYFYEWRVDKIRTTCVVIGAAPFVKGGAKNDYALSCFRWNNTTDSCPLKTRRKNVVLALPMLSTFCHELIVIQF